MQLTQKESGLLKDMKEQEKLCTQKYHKHAETALDPQLQALFVRIGQEEQQHYDTLVQIENGSVPSPGGGAKSQPAFTAVYGVANDPDKQSDCYLCSDVLASEKHASHLYDTCIFEFREESIRTALNHIQKEEQGHGKMIYDYMAKNDMYS